MTRGRAVMALLVAAGVMWIVSTRTWTQATVNAAQTVPGVAGTSQEQTGNSPLLAACAAVVGVCALLLAMLHGFGRWIVCVLAGLAGLGYAGLAVGTVAGGKAVTPWPAVGIALGVLAAAVAVWVALRMGTWRVSNRFERSAHGAATASPTDDPASAWDALTRGEDPEADAADAEADANDTDREDRG